MNERQDRQLLREIEDEGRHLHEVERVGESGATPFIALLGLIPFLALVLVVMMGLAFAAYFLG